MKGLSFELPIGVKIGGDTKKIVTLLPANGLAEEVYANKKAEKPYTWIGEVLAISIADIDGIPVGTVCREDYKKGEHISLPQVLLEMSLADVNTCLVEIHRRVWDSQLKNQKGTCIHCGRPFVGDIDLDKLSMGEENEKRLATESFDKLQVTLNYGWDYKAPPVQGAKNPLEQFTGVYDSFVYRVPALKDAIKHESHVGNTVNFWRRIAADCCIEVSNSLTNLVIDPIAYRSLGLRLYEEHLEGKDLKAIRTKLRDIPTMQVAYEDTCPNCQRQTPYVMEGNSFFSE